MTINFEGFACAITSGFVGRRLNETRMAADNSEDDFIARDWIRENLRITPLSRKQFNLKQAFNSFSKGIALFLAQPIKAEMSHLKRSLFDACRDVIRQKIERVQRSILETQQSANEETKSSAGDKYETGRAMAQLEIEKFTVQLAELHKQDQDLSRIDPGLAEVRVALGSVVHTNQGLFFIAVNAGEIRLDGRKFFAISPQAPIAQKMFGLSVKDTFVLNGRSFSIVAVE